ncbi:MAG TPA: hypothetical protein DDW17_05420 [Deltaproteobacteria bacterium]|nr:hypothetical protein [Deltaproteobacteria bacterium]
MVRITKDTEIGQEFAGKPKKMIWERVWTFSGGVFTSQGWPKKNLHTDIEFAQNLGLPTVGVSATQYLGHMAELMIDLFGEAWLNHGRMSNVKFIKLVVDGDMLVSKAKVVGKEQEGSTVKYVLDIYVENQNHDKVLVGTATGIAG